MPPAAPTGQYVPAKKGNRSGVRKTDIGHPPRPVIPSTASMYTWSRSGRSSRSTLMLMKCSLSSRAMSGFSKLSWAMTWHQWHDE
jgi:hypothetical protein